MIGNLPTILLIEDNEDDVFIFKQVMKKLGVLNPIQVATNGRDALSYLASAVKSADGPRRPVPFIIFIDLKLPYVDGFEVLKWISGERALDSVVSVVLTSSNLAKDSEQAHALGAKFYMVKPPDKQGMLKLFESLADFWGKTYQSSPVALRTGA